MTQPRKPLAKFTVVVQFAVKNYGDIPRLVPDGLLTTGQVDDAQPPHPQSESRRARIVHQKTVTIRTAMLHHSSHRADPRLRIVATVQKRNATNSAHAFT